MQHSITILPRFLQLLMKVLFPERNFWCTRMLPRYILSFFFLSMLTSSLIPCCFCVVYLNGRCVQITFIIVVQILMSHLNSFTVMVLVICRGFNSMLQSGSLLQQFYVDAWLCAEQNNLNYLRKNQTQMHVDRYQGLMNIKLVSGKNRKTKMMLVMITPQVFHLFYHSPIRALPEPDDVLGIFSAIGKPEYEQDEIRQHTDNPCLVVPETCQHFFMFFISHTTHKVFLLFLILPSDQRVVFRHRDMINAAAQNSALHHNQFTAFVEFNHQYFDTCRYFHIYVSREFVQDDR